MIKLPSAMERPARFAFVGVLCGVVDFSLFAIFVSLLIAPVWANVGSFILANMLAYVLNGKITFGSAAPLTVPGYCKFLSAYLVGLVISTALILWLTPHLGVYPTKILAVTIAGISNFVLSKKFVFRR